jgi:hypothetical protein
MKPKLLLTLLFLPVWTYLHAGDRLRAGDVRSMAMGGSAALISPLFNPSLLAWHEKRSLRLNYSNRYGLRELATVSGSLYLPDESLCAGVDVSSFGYEAYRESMIRLPMGKRLHERWALGLSVQYTFLQTELFDEQASYLSTDLGLTYSPVDKLLISLLIMDIPSIALRGESHDKRAFIRESIQLGLRGEVINSLFISALVDYEAGRGVGGSIGFEYMAFDEFSFRAGVKGSPLLPSFGFGYGFSSFEMDVAAIYHPVLGASLGVGLSFSF